MLRMAGVAGLLAALALGPVAPTAAADAESWETVRGEVIDPLNTALHRHLPTFLRKRDLDGVLGLYAAARGDGLTWDGPVELDDGAEERTRRWIGPGGEESIRARYQALLDAFADIDRVDLRIDRVGWRDADADGFPVGVRLLVRGTGPDGARAQLEQRAALRVRRDGERWEVTREEVLARTLVTRATPRFTRATASAGLDDVHDNVASPSFRLFGGGDDNPVRSGSGSAVADVDGDGCDDLFLAGNPRSTLYQGSCDGRFADVTELAGLPRPYPAAASGPVFFDYDDDGDPDLFVAAVRGGDRLFRNDGAWRFTDVTDQAGVGGGEWSATATVADYDRDGHLDLYVARMGDHESTAPRPNFHARNGVPNTLWRNRGDGTFEDVSRRAGVDGRGWDLGAAWGDYDGDGWPDLYVANEFGGNVLYHNEGDGSFSDRTGESGTLDGGAGMGVAWGDVDGDGDLDLYSSGMHANSGWALFHPAFPAPIPWYFRLLSTVTDEVERRTTDIMDRLTRGSTLYRNDGDGHFTDVSDAVGVRDAQWGWSAEFVDYDLDGDLDLYAVNGFISGPIQDDV